MHCPEASIQQSTGGDAHSLYVCRKSGAARLCTSHLCDACAHARAKPHKVMSRSVGAQRFTDSRGVNQGGWWQSGTAVGYSAIEMQAECTSSIERTTLGTFEHLSIMHFSFKVMLRPPSIEPSMPAPDVPVLHAVRPVLACCSDGPADETGARRKDQPIRRCVRKARVSDRSREECAPRCGPLGRRVGWARAFGRLRGFGRTDTQTLASKRFRRRTVRLTSLSAAPRHTGLEPGCRLDRRPSREESHETRGVHFR